MSSTMIQVENLGKRYTLGQQSDRHTSLRDAIAYGSRKLLRNLRSGRKRRSHQEEFWALRDVSFDVQQGDRIGIIGRNGAGKSTLLKVLSQITEPTEGQVRLGGRVASLLEVGTGFHPDLTGRENIFLNGAILGMSKAEIRRKFDEIVAFAEVERFLDTPVKRYSSGMYIRLAFAVAAHLEPEILVVDEVLAVGDVQFQNKCLGKMENVARHEGRTLIFVSHDMNAIRTLCNSVVYLQGGQVASIGDPETQIDAYLHTAHRSTHLHLQDAIPLCDTLHLRQLDFSPNPVISGEPVEFEIGLTALKSTLLTEFKLLIYSASNTRVAIVDLRQNSGGHRLDADHPLRLTGTIHSLPFVEGDYSIGIYINSPDINRDFLDLTRLTVHAAPNPRGIVPYPVRFRGVVELDFDFARKGASSTERPLTVQV